MQNLLDELYQEAPAPASGKRDLVKLRYTHEDCIDFIIANPGVSQNEIALRYGYTPTWVSILINTDTFRARLAARRAELVDPTIAATLSERFAALAQRSVDVLLEKLAMPASAVSDQLALQAAALGAKSLGMGVAAPPPAPPASNLDDLAERLRNFVRRPSTEGAIDVQAREVSPARPEAPHSSEPRAAA